MGRVTGSPCPGLGWFRLMEGTARREELKKQEVGVFISLISPGRIILDWLRLSTESHRACQLLLQLELLCWAAVAVLPLAPLLCCSFHEMHSIACWLVHTAVE